MKHRVTVIFASALLASGSAAAADLRVTMNVVTDAGIGASAGTVVVSETKHGVVFTPARTGVAPGLHGFHVHEKGSCAPSEKDGKQVAANAAGGHYDPDKTKKHGTPWGDGHRGDLPALFVDADGKAMNPVLAPRLKMAELKGKALMVHAGGDNHADHPAPLGGGGARVVCGVMK
jgi:Cu-Zn family superoxide dismutase